MRLERNDLVRGTLGVTLLAQMALSYRLWGLDRTFPEIPALSGLPNLPGLLSLLLTMLFAGAVVAFVALPKRSWPVLTVLGLGAVLVLFDINRLQPWFYLDGLLILTYAGGGTRRAIPAPVAPILAFTYLWSGVQKVNLGFATSVFPWFLQSFGLGRLAPLWFFAPLVEIAVAVLLLLPKARRYGIGLAIALHVFVLFALGPLGHNMNSVIWPWNVGMPVLVWSVFGKNDQPLLPVAWQPAVGKVALLLAGVMPALNFIGRWDDNLSANLYSGTTCDAFLLLTERGASKIPPEIQSYIQRRPDRIAIDVTRWGLADLNVPPYPEERVYRALVGKLQIPPSELTLVIAERRGFSAPRATVRVVPVDPALP